MIDNKLDLSIIIPGKNEEGNLDELFSRIDNAINELDIAAEAIFIDDGSTDNTWSKAKDCASRYNWIRLQRNRKNLGITRSLTIGHNLSKGKYLLLLPSDLESYPDEDIPKIYYKLIENEFDVVAGWRQGRQDGKNVASFIYNKFSNWLFNLDIHDKNWIKGYSRKVIKNLDLRSDWHRYIIMIFAHHGYKIGEVKTNWYPRKYGNSKFGYLRFPISIIDLLVLKFIFRFQEKPMMLFGGIGSFMILSGFSVILYWVIYFINNDIGFYIRPSIQVSLISIILGAFMFFTGFIAELIVGNRQAIDSIKREVKNSKK